MPARGRERSGPCSGGKGCTARTWRCGGPPGSGERSRGWRREKRGPKVAPADPRERKIVELERETRRLKSRLERAEALVDLQKKVSMLLGIALPESDEKL